MKLGYALGRHTELFFSSIESGGIQQSITLCTCPHADKSMAHLQAQILCVLRAVPVHQIAPTHTHAVPFTGKNDYFRP